jgi:hypothetical protein
MRCLFLIRRHGRATFDLARAEIPKHCDLTPEECRLSKSRIREPNWLIDIRNFDRDVVAGKERFFYKDFGGALKLTDLGEAMNKTISDEQLDRVIRRRRAAA